jgi:hypothetical protein
MSVKVSETNPNVETFTGERPRCHYCNKELKPLYDTRYDYKNPTAGRRFKMLSRKFLGVFGDGYSEKIKGYFCNQTCGYKFGRFMAAKGWKRTVKEHDGQE